MVTADQGRAPAEAVTRSAEAALRHDRARALLWPGRTNAWAAHLAETARARPGAWILDVAAGGGASARALAARGARVTVCDALPAGPPGVPLGRPGVRRLVADVRRLPFTDGAFDAVTVSFGLRGLADPQAALAETRRVTRPGGRLVVCEFGVPADPLPRTLFAVWLRHAVPLIGRRAGADPAVLARLADFLRAGPPPDRLARRILAAGWQKVAYRPLDGGVVHLYAGIAPGAGSGFRAESA